MVYLAISRRFLCLGARLSRRHPRFNYYRWWWLLSFKEWTSVHHLCKSNFLYVYIMEQKQIEYSWLDEHADLSSSSLSKVEKECNKKIHSHHSAQTNETHQKSKVTYNREAIAWKCSRVCMHETNCINFISGIRGAAASSPFLQNVPFVPRRHDNRPRSSPPTRQFPTPSYM